MTTKIIKKVTSGSLGIVHAVTEDWTEATYCGIEIVRYWKVSDKPITCKRCLQFLHLTPEEVR